VKQTSAAKASRVVHLDSRRAQVASVKNEKSRQNRFQTSIFATKRAVARSLTPKNATSPWISEVEASSGR
jgi:hypothetical protein